jgi:hypothetical protein
LDNRKKITATVCVYSGRPNPQWSVPQKEYDKLLPAVKALAETAPLPQPSLLGYTGIMITANGTHIHVFNENISVAENKNVKGYKDAGRVIEKKLLSAMPDAICKEIKGILPRELQKG